MMMMMMIVISSVPYGKISFDKKFFSGFVNLSISYIP